VKRLTRSVTSSVPAASILASVVPFLSVLLLAANICACTGTTDGLSGQSSNPKNFSSSDLKKNSKPNRPSSQEVSQLYQEERYKEVISWIELALEELPDDGSNMEKRAQLRSMLRLAKAKSLVARFHGKMRDIKEQSILDKQIPGLVITQTYGTVFLSHNENRQKVFTGESVYFGPTFFVREKSGLEITSENGEMIRAVDSTAFFFDGNRSIHFHEGTILLHLAKDAESFRVEAPLASVTLRAKKAATALISVTTSGGLKIIANERDMTIVLSDDDETKLRPGELVFALPEPQGLSRKMDVELTTILMTADLLTGFEDPVPFSGSLRLAAVVQAQRIKGRFRAVVGDVMTGDNFQVKVVEEKEKEGESKKKGGLSKFFRGILGHDEQ
jgi:hypothetical protein